VVRNVNEPEVTVSVPGEFEVGAGLSRTYDVGAAMRLPERDTIVTAQISDLTDENELGLRLGVERTFSRPAWTYALRAGYMGDAGALTAGAGIIYQDWTVDVAIATGDLNGTLYASVTGYF